MLTRDLTVLPASHTFIHNGMNLPAFTPQPQSVTALWPVLIFHPTEGRRLSWPEWLVIMVSWSLTSLFSTNMAISETKAGHKPRWYTRLQMVTNLSINWARHIVTSLIETKSSMWYVIFYCFCAMFRMIGWRNHFQLPKLLELLCCFAFCFLCHLISFHFGKYCTLIFIIVNMMVRSQCR